MDPKFSVTYIVFAVLAVGIGLTTVFYYYAFKYKEKEKNLAYDEDANPNSIRSTGSNQSKEPEAEFEEERSVEDSTDSEEEALDEAFREKVSREMDNQFHDLVFERVLAHIVLEVDDQTFKARFSGSDLTVTCYLKRELDYNLTRPVVGDLVRLEYNYGLGPRNYFIIQLLDSNYTNSKKKEGTPWIWSTCFAEIIEEYEEEERDERLFYARLGSLESGEGQVVLCKVNDYLQDTIIENGDIVYLEVNEKNRSFYQIIEIVDRCNY